jgi:hypothetical protein
LAAPCHALATAGLCTSRRTCSSPIGQRMATVTFPERIEPLPVARIQVSDLSFLLRGWSPQIQTECPPPYLGSTDGRGDGFRLRGCYPLWRPFPRPSTTHVLCNSLEEVQLPLSGPATPRQQRLHAVTLPRFRLTPVRSPLLRGSRLLSVPPGTEMFQLPGSVRASRDRRPVGGSPGLIAALARPHPDDAQASPPCLLFPPESKPPRRTEWNPELSRLTPFAFATPRGLDSAMVAEGRSPDPLNSRIRWGCHRFHPY